MAILEVHNVAKAFGSQQVLRSLSFSVEPGSIYGFVGENGAGKTTTMKLILGLEKLDAGQIKVLGRPVIFGENTTNRAIGYLPDVPEFYNFMTPFEYLKLCAQITGLKTTDQKARVIEILERVGLTAAAKKRIGGFSRGMKQRLGIAQALLGRPKLLICDEPTSALDPNGRHEFLSLLSRLKNETTILFSTHILSDVEQVCDHVGILNQGKMVANGTLTELKKRYGKPQIQLDFSSTVEQQQFLNRLAVTQLPVKAEPAAHSETLTLSLLAAVDQTTQAIFKLLGDNQIVPRVFIQQEPSLETIFLEVTR